MSEGDVSLIQDEDVLRRMWQQTEDFARKKEIRAHMYRLREERLRTLYSPEPTLQGKGCEFTSTPGHGRSFADQTFQSMKSKEVRDAASPTKEFAYRGQDLKELSNAGWNIESENTTRDDGHTRVRSVQANIEGRYDVEGGTGKFAAIDHHKSAVTEYNDDNTSLRRDQSTSNSNAHEKVIRQTDDGTHFASTTSSSSSTSKFEQISSTKQETVPYVTIDEADTSYHSPLNTNRNIHDTQLSQCVQNKEDTIIRGDYEQAELVSRNVEHPDEHTKVIVETRRLPDGTRVTSTRREFRAPLVQNSRIEQQSQKTKTEQSSYTSSRKTSENRHIHDNMDWKTSNIVDHQKFVDDTEFKKYRPNDFQENETLIKNDDYNDLNKNYTIKNEKDVDSQQQKNEVLQKTQFNEDMLSNIKNVARITNVMESQGNTKVTKIRDITTSEVQNNVLKQEKIKTDDVNKIYIDRHQNKKQDEDESTNKDLHTQNLQNTNKEVITKVSNQYVENKTNQKITEDVIEKKTTYQTDYSEKKISIDWSPTHQAWANTLRADTPSTTRPSTRASSPGNRTFKSSNSSLRSSVSPDKTNKKPPSRGGSPNKSDKSSPSRSSSHRINIKSEINRNRYTSPEKRQASSSPERRFPTSSLEKRCPSSSPERKYQDSSNPNRLSSSPNRKLQENNNRTSLSPEKHPQNMTSRSSNKTNYDYELVDEKIIETQKNFKIKGNKEQPRIDQSCETKKPTNSQQFRKPISRDSSQRERYEEGNAKSHRFSLSPERQTVNISPVRQNRNTSPEKTHPNPSPERRFPTSSPERRIPSSSPERKYPDSSASNRHSSSPNRISQENAKGTSPSPEKYHQDITTRSSNEFNNELVNKENMEKQKILKNKFSEVQSCNDQTIKNKETSDYYQFRKSPPREAPQPGQYAHEECDNKPCRPSLSPNRKTGNIPVSPDRHHIQDSRRSSSPKHNISRTQSPEKTITKDASEHQKQTSIQEVSQDVVPAKPGLHTQGRETGDEIPPPTNMDRKSSLYHGSTIIEKSIGSNDNTSALSKTTFENLQKPLGNKDKLDDLKPSPAILSQPQKPERSTSPIQSSNQRHVTPSSPERKYGKPNNTSQLNKDKPNLSPKSSPKRQLTSPEKIENQKSNKNSTLEENVSNYKTTSRVSKKQTEHQKFIDEESNYRLQESSFIPDKQPNSPRKSQSPLNKLSSDISASEPHDQLPLSSRSLKIPSRSPSPSKKSLQDTGFDDTQTHVVENINIVEDTFRHNINYNNDSVDRKQSQTKNDFKTGVDENNICDKRQNNITEPTKPSKYDTREITEAPDPVLVLSKNRSPSSKSPSKDEKYKDASDFINMEKVAGEKTKNAVNKSHHRQLITPSSSPTRKPCLTEKAPSTGHSSPTTSVSGFVYFSSSLSDKQITDNQVGSISKDLDSPENLNEKSETHLNRLSQTTSKIPCRSPSPEKRITQARDGLPRKSSLKKTTNNSTKLSPTEKPPTDFSVTSTKDDDSSKNKNYTFPEDNSCRPKPPLERRETYEERCRKILGMIDDSKVTTNNSYKSQQLESSPSISPCASPECSSIPNLVSKKKIDSKADVLEFINREQEEQTKHVIRREDDNHNIRTYSRETSPLKSPQPRRSFMSPSELKKDFETGEIVKNPDHLHASSPNKDVITKSTPVSQRPDKMSSPVPKSPLSELITRPKSRTPSPNKISTNKLNTDENKFGDLTTHKQVPSEKHSRTSSPLKETIKAEVQKTTQNMISIISNMTEKTRVKSDKDKNSVHKVSPSYKNIPDQPNTENQNTESNDTINKTHKQSMEEKALKENDVSKLAPRSTSPLKKPVSLPKNRELESPEKKRSSSPRKPMISMGRPQSPQTPTVYGNKSKESAFITSLKPSSITKVEKPCTVKENKKANVTSKQNLSTKNTPQINKIQISSNKVSEQDSRRRTVSTKQSYKEDTTKELSTKVTRTNSDSLIKVNNKPLPKVKSKPEFQVGNVTSTKINKQTSNIIKVPKSKLKESQSKSTDKPKTTATLSTSTENNDVTVDVQLAKSSRESSPDHICPTPVHFLDDIGTPRLPDEVSEPDDNYRRPTYHTIHETETIVDDIVEINEDDELFVKRSEAESITEPEDYLLDLNKKKTSIRQMETNQKPTISAAQLKDAEKQMHSDFLDNDFKSDECLLTVSEKVNKFAKGATNIKKDKSPSRNIIEEYDKQTDYQDDYTKLSVNDKAHFFVETAEKIKSNITKPMKIAERHNYSEVDDSLKRDDCLLNVSDKVNKFVRTAEQFLHETNDVQENNKKIEIEHDKIIKKIDQDSEIDTESLNRNHFDSESITDRSTHDPCNKLGSFTKETTSSHAKSKDFPSPNLKNTEKTQTVKITTLRSSEAIKKAKELFENISSNNQKGNEAKTTKLTDIGVVTRPSKVKATTIPHSSPDFIDNDDNMNINDHNATTSKSVTNLKEIQLQRPTKREDNTRHSPVKEFPEKSPSLGNTQPKYTAEDMTTQKHPEFVPSYQRPTKTSQLKEETKNMEETEVSSRRGSGKFGIELRRTSTERSTSSSERRRSVEHHQPCIEDIFDLDLLEQMLEKVVGYEQRRRIRAQIRIAKKIMEDELHINTNTFTKVKKAGVAITKSESPERHFKQQKSVSPERHITQKSSTILSSDRNRTKNVDKQLLNGHIKKQDIPHNSPRSPSPSKQKSNLTMKTVTSIRQPSPEKKIRTSSPIKTPPAKSKGNRFNEYATAYMKRVGINENIVKVSSNLKTKDVQSIANHEKDKQIEKHNTTQTKSNITSSIETHEYTTSTNNTKISQVNGKKSPSPTITQTPDRKVQGPTEKCQRSPSPKGQRQKSDAINKETLIKTVHDTDKKIHQKQVEEKPSWVTNRNLKKVTSETRTYSSKKLEPEKPKYRAPSPSKVISKPTDVITSSYGPGPLDADGKPLFGIRALRTGATNYQVKGTVIRQEFHSRNGGEPEGTVSVTAYSTEPEDLEKLLQAQGEKPSRFHGLAAITTTKKFGGDSGTTLKQAHSKEERSTLEQFTHSDRRLPESGSRAAPGPRPRGEWGHEQKTEKTQKQETEKKTVRQNSVKSLTEKYIKSTSEGGRTERPYPKAGLILRSSTLRDSVSSESSAPADPGLPRTDSEHSLASAEDAVETVTTSQQTRDGSYTSTTTRRVYTEARQGQVESRHPQMRRQHAETDGHGETRQEHSERSFLDSNTKVTGVQDILTRMKNADIVIEDGDSSEDAEARALLNKFLGASVLMAGMQGYVSDAPAGKVVVHQEVVRGGGARDSDRLQDTDLEQCWDERVLRQLLEECTDYEQRRRLRARLRSLMAEQEACTSAVTAALAAAEGGGGEAEGELGDAREEEAVTTVTSSVRRNSSEKTSTTTTTTTKTSKVIESLPRAAPKPASPFAKFRQLEKQNSTNSPKM